MPTPTDYSKWDAIGADSDDEATASSDPSHASKLTEQQYIMLLLTTWLSEAVPDLSDAEAAHLVRFVALQDRQKSDATQTRATIVDLVDGTKQTELKQDALLDLCLLAKERQEGTAEDSKEGSDVQAHAAASRVLMLATGALNTLGACRSETSARKFFDKLAADEASSNRLDEIDDRAGSARAGQLAAKYQTFGFATDALRVWSKEGGGMEFNDPGPAGRAHAATAAKVQAALPPPFSVKRAAWRLARGMSRHVLLVCGGLLIRYLLSLWRAWGDNDSREL